MAAIALMVRNEIIRVVLLELIGMEPNQLLIWNDTLSYFETKNSLVLNDRNLPQTSDIDTNKM